MSDPWGRPGRGEVPPPPPRPRQRAPGQEPSRGQVPAGGRAAEPAWRQRDRPPLERGEADQPPPERGQRERPPREPVRPALRRQPLLRKQVAAALRSTNERRKALLLREVLDLPVSLRRFPPGPRL